jgi:hypothetical protein
MDGINSKSAKISGPRPLPSTFFSLLNSTIRRFIVWTYEEQREMEADYSGGQSSPWAVAPRGRKKGIRIHYNSISWKLPDDDPAGSKRVANIHNKQILMQQYWFISNLLCWQLCTTMSHVLALTSPTSGGRSVGRYSSLADSSHGV